MKTMFQTISQHLRAGEDLVLVTVVASSGSTPRGAGSRMLLNKGGRIYSAACASLRRAAWSRKRPPP